MWRNQSAEDFYQIDTLVSEHYRNKRDIDNIREDLGLDDSRENAPFKITAIKESTSKKAATKRAAIQEQTNAKWEINGLDDARGNPPFKISAINEATSEKTAIKIGDTQEQMNAEGTPLAMTQSIRKQRL